MKNIAIIVNGQTFLKSMAPLVFFSNYVGLKPHVLIRKSRPGKPHDNVNLDTMKSILNLVNDFDAKLFIKDEQAISYLNQNKIKNVVCQDAQHHFKFLCKDFNVFSISVFYDTLHFANQHSGKPKSELSIPHKIYFPYKFLEEKFKEILGFSCNTTTLGSPFFDHALFVKKDAFLQSFPRDYTERVLFLPPPPICINKKIKRNLEEFVEYCDDNDICFLIKERPKSKWFSTEQFQKFKGNIFISSIESGFPYTSLESLMCTDIHITSYGTSIFESNFLGKPCINLSLDEGLSKNQRINRGNYLVSDYGMDKLYNNNLCKTVTGDDNFVNVYDIMKTRSRQNWERKITMQDNFSIDILKDIYDEI
jgi:hypothetical protein